MRCAWIKVLFKRRCIHRRALFGALGGGRQTRLNGASSCQSLPAHKFLETVSKQALRKQKIYSLQTPSLLSTIQVWFPHSSIRLSRFQILAKPRPPDRDESLIPNFPMRCLKSYCQQSLLPTPYQLHQQTYLSHPPHSKSHPSHVDRIASCSSSQIQLVQGSLPSPAVSDSTPGRFHG